MRDGARTRTAAHGRVQRAWSPRTAANIRADLVHRRRRRRARGRAGARGAVSTARTASSSMSTAAPRDPRIWAAGDCTSHPNRQYGRHMRLESVDNAFEQGTTRRTQPARHPDAARQGAVVLVGSVRPEAHHRRTERRATTASWCAATPASRSFSVCYLRGGELIAIDTVNSPKDQMAARKLIAARARPNPDEARRPAGRAQGHRLSS